MKRFLFIVIIALPYFIQAQVTQDFSELKGYYYNQTPPGDSAVIFAPGIFSLPNRLESNIAFSPDGKECYFGVVEIKDRKVSYKIYQSKFANNKWTEQTEAPFALNNNISDPILSADGKKLYFNKEGDIWMIERSSEKWGVPKKLPAPINSDANEGNITESADGVIYISSKRPEGFGGFDNWRINRLEDQWTAPVPSSYGGMPAFSLDGNKLYFISDETEEAKGLYFIEKQGENWSEPKSLNLIARFHELKYLYGPSITSNGTLYFFGHAEGLESMNNFGIYRSEFINGTYVKPELLLASINAAEGTLNWKPCIAPDESYLLFSSNRLNNQQDIFISFRHSDGTWIEAHNLGEAINTNRGERFPTLTPDGKYLFFTRWYGRNNEEVMWVSAKIIDRIRKKIME